MLGFLIAIVAGAVTPALEGPVARPVARAMGQSIEIQDGELRPLAFMLALIGAGLICAMLSTGSPLGLAVGATLGYFGGRLITAFRRAIDGRRSG